MQINIPAEVKIGARIVTVVWETIPEENVWGTYLSGDFVIILDPEKNANPQVAAETFIHELQHAIHEYAAFELTLAREVDDTTDPEEVFSFEEAVTDRVSKVWQQVLLDNQLVIEGDAPAVEVEIIE